jgi:muramoyltetrapeptide carboxypeptidase
MIKPPRLEPGDTVSVIAPAGPVDPAEVLPGIDRLQSLGFKVLTAKHLYERKEYLAGDDKARLEDLHSAFRNRDVKAIFCARGGYGAMRLLPKIRFQAIRANPKILVGYSDITSLLFSIYRKTGLVTFHGPTVREFSRNHGGNLEALVHLLSTDRPCSFSLEESAVLREGKAEGRLVGGNLTLMCHLVGTRHMPDLRGAILFLEDRGEPPYRIDRMLTHLRLCGFFKNVAAIIAGQFEDCGEKARIEELLLDSAAGLGIAVVNGFPIGHGDRNMTLPVGLPAVLDTASRTLRLTEAPVS